MDLELKAEQKEWRERARRLAQEEFAPRAAELDQTGEFPWENFVRLAEEGFLCMQIPREYGGAGADYLSYILTIEEFARACAATSAVYEVHNSLHAEPLWRFGTEEQKKKYLPRLARGEILGAFALTEPGAGSDAGALETVAVRDGDEYVINGTKRFISNAGQADLYLVMAMTDKSKGTKGITAMIVEKGTPGLSFGEPLQKLGIRASQTSEIYFENVRVPVENRVGQEGEGFKVALATLDGGRIGIGAQAVGIAQAALDRSIAYAKERVQFGQPIAKFQGIQWMLAEMATDIEVARTMVYRTATLRHNNIRASREMAMAKLFAASMAVRNTAKAVQIHGGNGYMREYEVERYMRDAKITEIYEGTSEIMKVIIAGSLLR